MAKLGTEGGGEEAFFLAVGGPFWRQIRQCWHKRGLQRQKTNGINAKEPFLIGKFLSWKTHGRRRVGGKEENPINSLKPFIPPLGGREEASEERRRRGVRKDIKFSLGKKGRKGRRGRESRFKGGGGHCVRRVVSGYFPGLLSGRGKPIRETACPHTTRSSQKVFRNSTRHQEAKNDAISQKRGIPVVMNDPHPFLP